MSKSEKLQKYKFCWDGVNPYSLVMLRAPKEMIQRLYQIVSISLLCYEPIQDKQIQLKRFLEQDKLQINLLFFKKIHELKLYVRNAKKHQHLVLLCSQQIKEGNNIIIKQLNSFQTNLRRIIYYDAEYRLVQAEKQFKNGNHVDIRQQIQKIAAEKYRKKTYTNFLPLKENQNDIKILTNTLKAIISVQPCQQSINKQLQALTLLLPFQKQEQMQDVEDFFNILKDKNMSGKNSIEWYTSQTFLYKILNNILRASRHPSQVFYVYHYLKNLFLTIQILHQNQMKSNQFQSITCYRGGVISENQLQYFRNSIGQIITNLGFLSTSTVKKLHFIENVQFIIKIKTKQLNLQFENGFAYLNEHSKFKGQNQILFNPLNLFKILSVCQKTINDLNYHQIVLQYGTVSQILRKKQNLTNQQQRIKWIVQSELNKNRKLNFFGQLLTEFLSQKLQGAQQYWKQFTKISSSINKIYGMKQLSKIMVHNHNFQGAINQAQQCVKQIQQLIKNSSNRTQKQLKLLLISNYQIIISCQIAKGNINQADKIIDTYIQNLKKISDLPTLRLAQSYTFKSIIEKGKNLSKAQIYIKKALQIIRILNCQKSIVYLYNLNLLSQIYLQLNKIEELYSSIELYIQIAKIVHQNQLYLANYLCKFGEYCVRYQQPILALKFFNRSKQIKILYYQENSQQLFELDLKISQVYFLICELQNASKILASCSFDFDTKNKQNRVLYSLYLKLKLQIKSHQVNSIMLQELFKQYEDIISTLELQSKDVQYFMSQIKTNCYYNQRKIKQAKQSCKIYCRQTANKFGQKSVQYINSLYMLIRIQEQNQQLQIASQICDKIIKLTEQQKETNSSYYITALLKKSQIQRRLQNFQKSLQITQTCLEINNQFSNQNNILSIMLMQRLSLDYYKLKDYKKCYQSAKKGLMMLKSYNVIINNYKNQQLVQQMAKYNIDTLQNIKISLIELKKFCQIPERIEQVCILDF